MKNISVISNKYQGLINRVVANPIAVVNGSHSTNEFKSAVAPIFRQSYNDIVIFDITSVNEKYLEAIRYLKMNLPSDNRIIVLYPGLDKVEELQQILVYGVYDIVNTKYDPNTMDDAQIEALIQSELQWAIDEPTTFSKVADKLSISVITENVIIEKETKAAEEKPVKKPKKQKEPIETPKLIKALTKPRLIGYFKDDNTSFSNLISSGKYNIVSLEKADEEAISQTDFTAIDLIVFDNCDSEIVSYTKSLISVNEIDTHIIAGYSTAQVEEVTGVNYFTYDSLESFARMVSINANKRKKVDISGNRIYAVYGVKGGVGSTTITALMARDYKKNHPNSRVCVIDFGAKGGDIGEKFGIETPNPNLFECVMSFAKARSEHLDIDILKNKTLEYCHSKDGVFVIPTSYTDIYKYSDYRIKTADIAYIYRYILLTLKEQFDAVFVDVTKFGGFTYDIAIEEADKIILVSDCKLSSVSHLLSTYEALKDGEIASKVTAVINRSDVYSNENQYELSKIINTTFDEDRVVFLPFDKKIDQEEIMMKLEAGKKFIKGFGDIWAAIDFIPKPKKKLFGK